MPPRLASAPGSIGKNSPVLLDLLVELLARDARLHRDGQVLGMDGQHLVHAPEVDADATLHRQQMPLERGAHTKRDHRYLVGVGQRHDAGHFGGRLGKHHRSRRWCGKGGFVAAMLLAHHQRGGALFRASSMAWGVSRCVASRWAKEVWAFMGWALQGIRDNFSF
jgi:hypothetical protein